MSCKRCGSEAADNFTAEIAIHFRGLKNTDKPHVWVFPELVVCLKCGLAEFVIPEEQLKQLASGLSRGDASSMH